MAARFRYFGLPMLFSTAAASLYPALGWVTLVGTGAFSAWHWRYRSSEDRVVLRVESRELTARVGSRVLARVRLADLEDVSLDTKTVRPVLEGGTVVAGARFIESRVGPEVDLARIALVGDGQSVLLNDAYVANITATDALGKIRTFLRAHGWVPLDERATD